MRSEMKDLPMNSCNEKSIVDFYEVGGRISENSCGSGGEILRGKRQCDGKEIAIKKIAKRTSIEGKSQISAWERLQHQNIVEMIDWFEDLDHIFIVMELANGGDMYDRIIKKCNGKMPEKDALAAFTQILAGVRHMHSKNVIHCDIKPENILCMSPDDDVIKLADFGFAQVLDEGFHILKYQGTLTYTAPEVIDGREYDSKADMWSLGVLLYSMLAGFAPFGQREARSRLISKIRQCQLNFSYEVFRTVSPEAQDLIRKLVVASPQQRLSAAEALRHPWIVNNVILQGEKDNDKAKIEALAEGIKAL